MRRGRDTLQLQAKKRSKQTAFPAIIEEYIDSLIKIQHQKNWQTTIN